ncbi:MAG: hypothetical protein AMJ79_10635 [Phycisphaerae bacterium SM23_30]|nr:MAG: hypothetical protein AMJ79_10635 [Phycisphaerae bacterium SM23_30]
MAVAFFAGVLASLFFLVPGKTGPTILVNGDRTQQVADLGQAGEKIEKFSDAALGYAYQAKEYVCQKLSKEE